MSAPKNVSPSRRNTENRAASVFSRPVHVAVEGLDGSGKSTTTKALADALAAVLITNPPKSFWTERASADLRNEEERREWYRAANFAAQSEAEELLRQGASVVFDRSFASTAAFAAATAGRVASAAEWPEDLGQPDLIVLLNLDEETRRGRIDGRGGDGTSEEQRLRDESDFRLRVLAGLKALGALPVDATRSVDEVIAQILRLLADVFGEEE